MKFIELTLTSGHSVVVNVDRIIDFRGVDNNNYKSEVHLDGGVMTWCVKEYPVQIMNLINGD